jgi:hypothetical protein
VRVTGTWELAQINVGRLVAPAEDPQVADFMAALGTVNAMAEAASGFVWRLKDEEGAGATEIRPAPDPQFIVNMSVWADADSLFQFVYRSAHTPFMARRRDWFGRFEGAYQALWWIEAGHRPTIEEGLSRLWLLDRYGPSEKAFTFKARFPAPDEAGRPVDMQPDPWCVGRA